VALPDIDLIKRLRDETGAGVMECKRALEQCGSYEAAVAHLRRKGLAIAQKKTHRATHEGLVEAYIHADGRLGSLVEVNCETDFVARTEEFKRLAHELAMQVAATGPSYVSREDVPPEVVQGWRSELLQEAEASGKPPSVLERIVQGRLEKYFQQSCLLEQPYIRDPERTVKELIDEHVARFGENIRVRRFVRFEVSG